VEVERGLRRADQLCRDTLGIDPDKLNVDGGSICVGRGMGATGLFEIVP